jgi:thermitase
VTRRLAAAALLCAVLTALVSTSAPRATAVLAKATAAPATDRERPKRTAAPAKHARARAKKAHAKRTRAHRAHVQRRIRATRWTHVVIPRRNVSAALNAPAAAAKSAAPATPATTAAPAAPAAPNDPAWPQEWGLAQVHLPEAWQTVPAPNTVVVAVVDSGVNAAQPDLAGRVTTGYDVFDGSANTNDDFGHGTLVAGVIAARTGNGVGIAGICGSCTIMPVKALDAQGVGTSTGIAAGINWAVDHGANIVNLSIVLSGDSPDVRAAVEYAHDRGVLVVAAAGNDGGGNATYPASYPGVLSVAATDPSGQRYSWSTYGDWVSVAAPGCTPSTAADGSYPQFCGTSAAAPFVAGLAGLAMATGVPSALAAGAALQQTAHALPGVAQGGLVDALALVRQFAH